MPSYVKDSQESMLDPKLDQDKAYDFLLFHFISYYQSNEKIETPWKDTTNKTDMNFINVKLGRNKGNFRYDFVTLINFNSLVKQSHKPSKMIKICGSMSNLIKSVPRMLDKSLKILK